VRRFTLITLIVIIVALVALAVYQISLGLTVEDRLPGPTPTASPQLSPR
jgi:hypothetical protein